MTIVLNGHHQNATDFSRCPTLPRELPPHLRYESDWGLLRNPNCGSGCQVFNIAKECQTEILALFGKVGILRVLPHPVPRDKKTGVTLFATGTNSPRLSRAPA
jgi:hypothetical protein